MSKPIVILGCTASGKSSLAEALADRLGQEHGTPPIPLMAVDSMQVYRGMDIGTAKPTATDRAHFQYYMIDIANPWEAYSAARFVEQARPLLENPLPLPAQSSVLSPQSFSAPILVAGTILYLRSLIQGLFQGPSADPALRAELQERARVEGTIMLHSELARLDPAAAAKIHPNDLRRIIRALEIFRLTGKPISQLQTQWEEKKSDEAESPALEPLYIGIRRDKEILSRRINARVKKMIELGLVDEVRRLANNPPGFSPEAASAVGYKQLLEHFAGKMSLDEAIEQIKIQTRYLAKMQRTWLKRWPPPVTVHWLDAPENIEGPDLLEPALAVIRDKIASAQLDL